MQVADAVGIAVDIGQAQPRGELTAYLLLYRMRELDSVVACLKYPQLLLICKRVKRQRIYEPVSSSLKA